MFQLFMTYYLRTILQPPPLSAQVVKKVPLILRQPHGMAVGDSWEWTPAGMTAHGILSGTNVPTAYDIRVLCLELQPYPSRPRRADVRCGFEFKQAQHDGHAHVVGVGIVRPRLSSTKTQKSAR